MGETISSRRGFFGKFGSVRSLLRTRVAHPWLWIWGMLLVCSAPLFFPLIHFRPFFSGPVKPLEEVLWTSDTSRTVFFGPGTPESLALARQLRAIIHFRDQDGAVRGPGFSEPVYIAPLIDPAARENDVSLLYPFTPERAVMIKKDHQGNPSGSAGGHPKLDNSVSK